MANYRKQGSKQLISKLQRNFQRNGGVTPAYIEMAEILKEREKLPEELKKFYLNPVETAPEKTPNTDSRTSKGLTDVLAQIMGNTPQEDDDSEVYEPHLESAIQQKPVEDDENEIPTVLDNVTPTEEKSKGRVKKTKRMNKRVRYSNSRDIVKGDTVRFYSRKDEEELEGTVIGTTTGTRDEYPYFKIKYELDDKSYTTFKRDYACLLIIDGTPAGEKIS